jgi:hypothetical protein
MLNGESKWSGFRWSPSITSTKGSTRCSRRLIDEELVSRVKPTKTILVRGVPKRCMYDRQTKATRTARGVRSPRAERDAHASLSARGRKIPASPNLGIPKAQVDPVGKKGNRRQTTGDRYERICIFTSSLKPQVSSLPEGQESELIISLIHLLSCGGRERRMPLKSKEDSANAVGVAPMALPLDLAMEVGTPGRKPSS